MKKMLLATALALLITGCAQRTFTVQNKPAAVAPKETITPSFLRFWNWAGKKTVDAAKNLWRRRNVVKAETPANIRKMDCSVLLAITLKHLCLSAGKRGMCSQ